MFRQTIKKRFSLILLFLISQSVFGASPWQNLNPGLDYLNLASKKESLWSAIHAFRINPQTHKLQLIFARDIKENAASVEEFIQHLPALITINGGFFDNSHAPLGLRINNFKLESPFKKISWWGIFLIKNGKPKIIAGKDYRADAAIEFAIQAGPRLVVNGEIPKLKGGLAERTALCINKKGQLIIIVTENFPLTTEALATRLKGAPCNCVQAINLDGGSSSQIFAEIKDFKVHVPGFSRVSDGIAVLEKSPE